MGHLTGSTRPRFGSCGGCFLKDLVPFGVCFIFYHLHPLCPQFPCLGSPLSYQGPCIHPVDVWAGGKGKVRSAEYAFSPCTVLLHISRFVPQLLSVFYVQLPPIHYCICSLAYSNTRQRKLCVVEQWFSLSVLVYVAFPPALQYQLYCAWHFGLQADVMEAAECCWRSHLWEHIFNFDKITW